MKHIQLYTALHGYQVMLCNSNGILEIEKKNIEIFLQNGVDGVIDVAPRMKLSEIEKIVSVPMVIVDSPTSKTEKNIAFVHADNFTGAEAVAEYFVKKGYTRFLCFSGPVEDVPNAKMRTEGFLSKLTKLGVSPESCKIHNCDFTFESGYDIMEQIIINRTLEQQCAAFISSDIVAWGAMEALKTYDFKIGRDIFIVGYDNIRYSNFIYPKLTTVENPTDLLGINAAKLIIEALDKSKNLSGVSIVLPSHLIVRNSS